MTKTELKYVRGDEWAIPLNIYEEGEVKDLTDFTVTIYLKKYRGTVDDSLLFSWNGTIAAPATGQVIFERTYAESELIDAGTYSFEVKMYKAAYDDLLTIAGGTFIVEEPLHIVS